MAEFIPNIVVPLILLLLGFFAGRVAERNHYNSIHEREEEFLTQPAITIKTLDDGREVQDAVLAVRVRR